MFNKGDRARHIHTDKVVVVERDDGGETVHVAYPGGRSQRVPRGVLVPIESPKIKEDTSAAAKNTPLKISAARIELLTFMREVQTPHDVNQLNAHFLLGMVISPVSSFGMNKMQVMNKLWMRLKSGTLKPADLWKWIRP